MSVKTLLNFPSVTTVIAVVFGTLAFSNCECNAQSITILNPSFEDNVTTAFVFGIDHWTHSGDSGTFNPDSSHYVGGIVPHGVNVAFSSVGGPDISQTLSDVLLADQLYTLSIEVGNRADSNFPGYEVELLAGGQVLAADLNTLTVTSGSFATSVVQYTSSSADTQLGQALGIRFRSLGQQANFDDVRLTVSPIPEPSSAVGLMFFTTSIWLTRRKRR